MATTPRLGLNLPEGNDLADAPVKTSISDQFGVLDDYMDGKLINPQNTGLNFNGRIIWSFLNVMWIHKTLVDAGPWTSIATSDRPRGRIAFISNTSGGVTVAAGQEKGPYIQATVSLNPNRKYNIHWTHNVDMVSGSNADLTRTNIRVAQGATVTTSSTNISAVWTDVAERGSTLSVPHSGFTTYDPGGIAPNTQFTFGMFLERLSSADGKTVVFAGAQYNVLAIEDVGTKA